MTLMSKPRVKTEGGLIVDVGILTRYYCNILLVHSTERFHSSSRSGIRSGMITNPIYDSPIYDIIKDEKGKLISSSAAASPLSDGFPEFPQATIDDSKLVDFPLEPQAANAKQALEPRYSSTSNSENSESVYVKMKGKVNSTHDGSTLEPGDDKKLRLGQVTMV